MTRPIFVEGDKHFISIKHDAKSESIRAWLNKTEQIHTNIPFDDPASAFPIVLVDEESVIKAEIGWDAKHEEHFLDIEGVPYESLPYLDPNFNRNTSAIKTFSGEIYFNGI